MSAPIVDIPHAPFIFYEAAPAFGHCNGVANVTLSAMCTCVGDNGGPQNHLVAVAYLRGNLQAALSLRNALNHVLLMATKTEGEAN